ncbi:MAG TPA: VOC family protein [Prolixibacteraceae bacterium]
MHLNKIHHIAIICSDYKKSKAFYTDILGFTVKAEIFRAERNSWKLDLEVNGDYQIELFSFENPPERLTQPEARGLRHLAFETNHVEDVYNELIAKQIVCESIRIDEYTEKRFFFTTDPDHLPIEFYEK